MMAREPEHQKRWNKRHAEAREIGRPARVLEENSYLLPSSGRALDMASGMGANALLMARSGLDVTAWDFSQVAINRLVKAAEAEDLPLKAQVRDLLSQPPEAESFDVIVVSHFLERSLAHDILAALRPGGILFYQTFTRSRITDADPSNPAYRLDDNELLSLFSPLKLRVYREEGALGDTARGWRDLAMLVGEKSD